MFESFRALLGGAYAPHGYCLLWDPWLIWTMAGSDVLIALAYFSIPIALVTFVRRRRDIAFGGVFWLFALFITACGLTHVVALWNLWHGAYEVEAAVKLVTAGVSVLTAAILWPLLPKMLALPSPAHLRDANTALRTEIAEREKAEAALIQARKMEAVGQLTGGIAHDFNNLLQVVSGSLDLIVARTADDPQIQHLSTAALAALDRGRRLTGQLLSFSRIQRVEFRPIRIAELLTGFQELLSRTLGPSIKLRVDAGNGDDGVIADAAELELALLNLALNARDAMPDGGKLTLSVKGVRLEGQPGVEDGDYVGISVSDTGTGMTEEVRARVFEPFFTTKAVGRGSGLGLSMVFGMASQSGGTATVESRLGKGSTVTIFLRRADLGEAPAEPVPQPKAGAVGGIAGLSVLVVDDEGIVREVVAEMLADMGCIVSTAENGSRALALIEKSPPRAMLLDYAMPGMNGADVARAAIALHPDIRIVFATGFAQFEAIDGVVGEHAILLRKPFSPSELAAALEQAIAD